MWILESNGDFLQGKRVWLRPGQRYLFGRVKKDGVFQAIDHKGVSRRQCVIEVAEVPSGDGSLLHRRSKVTVTDENSRSGTYLDGRLLKGTSQELKRPEHVLKLGAYPHPLTIKWHPVCLSFFLTSKEKKNTDALGPKRALLEPLDIKTVQPFVSSHTTHVVATKRNTVLGLQALITGKCIVDHSYIDALVFATTPEDLEGDENLSLLEKDFDAGWPDPLQHLPPRGREPTAKLAESYAPDAARENIFEGWTFVFLEPGQYESILPAVTTGHGKALLYNIEAGKTTAEDVVTYMRNAAGEKGFGNFDMSTDGGGLIMVKPTLKKEWSDWGDGLVNEVALKLGQKYIDQADFLDAILSNDASSLRNAIPFQRADESGAPLAAATSSAEIQALQSASFPHETYSIPQANGAQGNSDVHSPEPTQHKTPEREPPPPRRRPRTRAAPVSRFKAFDDEFDMDNVAPFEPPEESADSQTYPSQEAPATPISTEDRPPQSHERNSRATKRNRSSAEDEMVDGLLPAAAAMKRRKLEIDRENEGRGASIEQASGHGRQATQKAAPKKEIDIKAAARERREAEEAARREQEASEAKLGDITVEDAKKLAVVEEMEVPCRRENSTRADRNASGCWDEKWNGRKNFKKFRRQGEDTGAVRRHAQRVIVPVVEVKRKNYGIGEIYWSSSRNRDSDSGHKSSRSEGLSSQTQNRTQAQTEPSAEDSTLPPTPLEQEAAEIVGAVDVDRPRQTRLADKTCPSQHAMNSSRGKRPASSAAAGPPKKQRTIRTRAASDSESDEELRFKFGNRRR